MTYGTVAAAKDPRLPEPPRANAENWSASIPGLSPRQAETLAALAMTFCPHDWMGPEPYRDAVVAISMGLGNGSDDAIMLAEGLDKLDQGDTPFIEMDDEAREARVAELSDTAFFRLSLRLVKRYLYDLPEVWAGCGYDGAAGCSDSEPRKDFGNWEACQDG